MAMSDPMLRLARGAGARARVGNAAGRAIVLLLPAISFAVCVHSNAGSLRRAPPPFPLLAPGRFPLLQAAAPRTGPEPWGATAIGRLRGGFDVWGDDEEDDTVAAGGARGGERMSAVGVREAAKKAAAAAAAFKAAKTAAAGCGAARKDQEPGTSAVVSTGPAAEAKDAEADVDAELAMLMARQKMAMEADKKGATSSDHDGKHDGKRRAGEDGGYQGTYQGGEDCTEQGSQQGGGENEEEDVDQESEDFDGYDDLGWGGQQPLLGKDIAELVDGSDFDDEGWVDHLSSSEHAPDDTFATAETTANSLSATAHSVSADGKAGARGVAGMGSVKGEGRNQGRERGSSPSPVDKDSRAEEDVKAARVGEEELQNEQQVFYPHPMWIRKELLEAYVEPYLEDGRLRGGIKGALRNLKKLLEAGAVTDAQFKARKTLLKKRDKGQTTDDEAGGLVGKDSPEAAEAGSETDDTDVKNVPKTSTSKQSQGRGQAKGGREGTMNELVPLDQIVLPKAGVCAMDGSQDQHYRYKMPVLQVKVEGTTKMIRTVLTNIEQVARAVMRPASYLVTYLGQEVSSMSQIGKASGDQKAWLSGKHEQEHLQLLVFRFIRETVLCPSCLNPETTVSIAGKRKRRAVMLTCGACGVESLVPPSTRFVKWMAQHPPQANDISSWGRVTCTTEQEDTGQEIHEETLVDSTDAIPAQRLHTPVEHRAGGAGDWSEAMEPKTLDEVSDFKHKEAARLRSLRDSGAISEERYATLKEDVKKRCKALKAALTGP